MPNIETTIRTIEDAIRDWMGNGRSRKLVTVITNVDAAGGSVIRIYRDHEQTPRWYMIRGFFFPGTNMKKAEISVDVQDEQDVDEVFKTIGRILS